MQVFHTTVSANHTITVTDEMIKAVGIFKDDLGLVWDFILELPRYLLVSDLDESREVRVPFEAGTKLTLSYNPFRGQYLNVEE